jgi:hypothetical protein
VTGFVRDSRSFVRHTSQELIASRVAATKKQKGVTDAEIEASVQEKVKSFASAEDQSDSITLSNVTIVWSGGDQRVV